MNYNDAKNKYIKNALLFEVSNFKISRELKMYTDELYKKIDDYIKSKYLNGVLIGNKKALEKEIDEIIIKSFEKMDNYLIAEMSTVYKVESVAAASILKSQIGKRMNKDLTTDNLTKSISNTRDIIKSNKFYTVEFTKFKKDIHTNILKNVTYTLINSKTYLEAAKLISKSNMASGLKTSQVQTLSRTMMKNVQNDAVINTIKEADIEYVKLIGIMDVRQTDSCRSLSNKVFRIDDAPPLPLHYNCRSTYVSIPPWEVETAKRDLMSFKDWYKKNKNDPDLKRLKYMY